MTREQAINYLYSSGMTKEQVQTVVKALEQAPTKSCSTCRNKNSHNGVCDICKDFNCWTEPTPKESLVIEDCISRADVNKIIDCPNFRQADKLIQIMKLPSVEPKAKTDAIPTTNVYKAIQEMMKYEHEGFINISLVRLQEILKKCGVEDGNDD